MDAIVNLDIYYNLRFYAGDSACRNKVRDESGHRMG